MSKGERYSKVSRRMWNDETFRALTAPQPNAQTLWQRFLTGPELTNIPGCFQAWDAGLAKALRWSPEGFTKAYEECFRHGLVKADWEVGFVYVPKAIQHNRPENPNVVRSWKTTWDLLPECSLKDQAYREIKSFLKGLGKGYAEAFEEGCRNHCHNQEQEQEQEQEEREAPLPKPERPEPANDAKSGSRIQAAPPADAPRDPLRESVTRSGPQHRPDVIRLHEAWKNTFGMSGHKFRSGSDEPRILAEAIDSHGMADCLSALKEAPHDGMVSGIKDEKGDKHESIGYIFGNAQAFARILREAQKKQRESGESVAEMIARRKRQEPGAA